MPRFIGTNINLPMITSDLLNLGLIGLALGLSLPLVGVFVILRREALISDAFSHVLLLGIALSLTFKINLILGIFAFAIIAGLLINLVRNKSSLSVDAVVGIFFTTSLALGSLMISSEELLESFLGDITKITQVDVTLSAGLAFFLIVALLVKFREFTFTSFAPDLAQVDGLKVKRYELAFTLILALAVAMGIKLVGTLLISALIIVPAATAKIFSLQIRTMAIWSMFFGLLAMLAGLFVSGTLGSPPGPTIILLSSTVFFLVLILHSLFKRG